MKPKEIDRQIAEGVMGYEKRPIYGIGWWKKDKDNRWKPIAYSFKPSTNISHAFEVVEKMREKFYFEIQDKNGSVFCASFEHKTRPGIYIGCDKNPAMAICLAALETIKIKNETRR